MPRLCHCSISWLKNIPCRTASGDLDNLAGLVNRCSWMTTARSAELRASYRILKILATCHRS
jgi:hypothetical protein